MIVARAWAGKRYAVLGLARSGAATVAALLAGDAEVLAFDNDDAKLKVVRAAHRPLEGERLFIDDFTDWTDFDVDALVFSPGIPLNTHPLAARARDVGVPVIGDIELLAQARADLPAHKVVGITGTNGKSTTTALVHHILQTASVPSLMGGNIGLPILDQEPLPEGGVYVLELSSYQIDLMRTLACDVAVLLNVTPDHLDRYDGFDAYAASKARLFEMQAQGQTALIGQDDTCQRIAADLSGALRIDPDGLDQSDWPSLKGPHNAANAAAAIGVARALGIDEDDIAKGLRTFAGLPHRMERVGERNGVAFVNDSKATNPESTAPALGAFARVHWIVGGKAKGDDLDACRPYLSHVACAYTIGDAGSRFADVLRPYVPVEEAGTLDRAVASAAAAATAGETVLLSPAAASFDQFRDYEHRGAAFRALVERLS